MGGNRICRSKEDEKKTKKGLKVSEKTATRSLTSREKCMALTVRTIIGVINDETDSKGWAIAVLGKSGLLKKLTGVAQTDPESTGFVGRWEIKKKLKASRLQLEVSAIIIQSAIDNCNKGISILNVVFPCDIIRQWIEDEVFTGDDSLKEIVGKLKEMVCQLKSKLNGGTVINFKVPKGSWSRTEIEMIPGDIEEIRQDLMRHARQAGLDAEGIIKSGRDGSEIGGGRVVGYEELQVRERRERDLSDECLLDRVQSYMGISADGHTGIRIDLLVNAPDGQARKDMMEQFVKTDNEAEMMNLLKHMCRLEIFINPDSLNSTADQQAKTSGSGVCLPFSVFQAVQLRKAGEVDPCEVNFQDLEVRYEFASWLQYYADQLQNQIDRFPSGSDLHSRAVNQQRTMRQIAVFAENDYARLGDQWGNRNLWPDRELIETLFYTCHTRNDTPLQLLASSRLPGDWVQIVADNRIPQDFHLANFTYNDVVKMYQNDVVYRQMHNQATAHYYLSSIYSEGKVNRVHEAIKSIASYFLSEARRIREGRAKIATLYPCNQIVTPAVARRLPSTGVKSCNKLQLDMQPDDMSIGSSNQSEVGSTSAAELQDGGTTGGYDGIASPMSPSILEAEAEDTPREFDEIVSPTNSARSGSVLGNTSRNEESTKKQRRILTASDFQYCTATEVRSGKGKPKVICACGQMMIKSNFDKGKHFKVARHVEFVGKELAARNPAPQVLDEADDIDMGGCTMNTPLDEIPLVELQQYIVWLGNPLPIPENRAARVRKAYTKLIEQAAEDPTNDKLLVRVILLPIIAAVPKNERSQRGGLDLMLDYIENDQWDLITLGWFKLKPDLPMQLPGAKANEDNINEIPPEIINRVQRLIAEGEVGKAMRVLTRTGRTVLADQETVQQLRDKHPHAGEIDNEVVPEEEYQEMLKYVAPFDKHMHVEAQHLRKIILRMHKGITPGLDKASAEFYAKMIGYGNPEKVDEIRFGEALSKLLALILNVQISPDIMKLLRNIELLSLGKGEKDIRPIGINSFLRKLCSILFMEQVNACATPGVGGSWVRQYFGDLQMQGMKGGCEKIIHLFRELQERYPELGITALDADNAFNRGNRAVGLMEVFKGPLQHLIGYVKAMYGPDADTVGFFRSFETDGTMVVSRIDIHTGCVQGCVLASWFYSMMIQPFVKKLDELLSPDADANSTTVGGVGSVDSRTVGDIETSDVAVVRFYIDDGNFATNFEKQILAIQYVISEGPKYGYFVKLNKGAIGVGACGSLAEALRRKEAIMKLGFEEAIIHIHPSNYADEVMDHDDRLSVHVNYGFKILGAYIGDPAYVHTSLDAKYGELAEVADKLIRYPDRQGRNLMLRWCFTSMGSYWLRVQQPHETEQFANAFAELQKKVLCSLLNPDHTNLYDSSDIEDMLWLQCNLTISLGGLGLGFIAETRFAAYVASLTESLLHMSSVFPAIISEIDDENDVINCQPYKQAIGNLKTYNADIDSESIRMLMEQLAKPRERDEAEEDITLQQCLFKHQKQHKQKVLIESLQLDKMGMQWYKSLTNTAAGAWLNQTPKHPSMFMPSHQFNICLLLRLHQPIPLCPPNSSCDCKNHPKLDAYGKHLAVGCNMENRRSNSHNLVQRELYQCIRHNGFYATMEDKIYHDSHGKIRVLRTDIAVINAPESKATITHYDLRLSYPNEKDANSLISDDSAAMESAQAEKRAKYQQTCNQQDAEFRPLIIGIPGNMDKETLTLINLVTERYSKALGIKHAIVKRYWITRISCTLQRAIASAILQRATSVNAKRSKFNDPSPSSIHMFGVIDTRHPR